LVRTFLSILVKIEKRAKKKEEKTMELITKLILKGSRNSCGAKSGVFIFFAKFLMALKFPKYLK
jgi:hypothetical protein